MFDGDRIDTVWKPNVLVRHLAQRNHKEASVASRKTSEAKKRVTFGPHQKITTFHGAQIDTVLTWGRKNAMEPKFWWGILRMRTTCRRLLQVGKRQHQKEMVPLESLEHVNQRRWWLYKVWAPSKITIENYNFQWGSNRHRFVYPRISRRLFWWGIFVSGQHVSFRWKS